MPRSIKQTHGGIFYLGQDLQAIDEKARRELLSKEISMIPQDPLTAMNPVRKIKAQAIESIRGLGMDAKKSHDYLCEILSKIKIKDPELVMDYYPFNLSGGMRQRILIACAFAKKPKFIIADEPTTALDVTVQKDVLKLIKQMQSEYQTAMLFITHDLGVVANIADDVSVLFQGRVMESGDVETVINHSKSEYTKALIDASPQYFMNDLPKPIDNALIERLLKETDLYKAKNE
ncbi:MAG: ABC transporter ATP-binding protein [Proteobacteria bacterium]|nr:ABC transporter ATP-binding protein [Pseudomonadota bacterium]